MDSVRAYFPPEFLNRLDDTILFNKLRREDMARIVNIQLKGVRELLEERKIALDISEEAVTELAERSYDPQYGARPLKRNIQKWILNPLAKMLLSGEVRDSETVRVIRRQEGADDVIAVVGNHPKRSTLTE